MEQIKWVEGTVGKGIENSLSKGREVGRQGPVGRVGHVTMAKNQFLGPEARALDPSPPFTHQRTAGNSCDSTSPHFPRQYDGANDTFTLQGCPDSK